MPASTADVEGKEEVSGESSSEEDALGKKKEGSLGVRRKSEPEKKNRKTKGKRK